MPLNCYRCDTEADGEMDALPSGWETRDSASLGTYPICATCAAKNTRPAASGDAPSAAQSRLRSIIERVENVEADMAALADDRAEIYAEAKGEGYDVKILRMIVRERKKDPARRQEEQDLFDLYATAIGGL